MKLRIVLCLICVCLLTGCASLLEREYNTVEPHSSKFWESEAAAILRAENYQDVVNDLLLLIGEYRETATLRLYNFADDLEVADALERATMEIQQETPLGAYAVQYITSYYEAQRGYYEAQIQIGYRRTAEQIQSIASTTTPEALYSLLTATLDEERTELVVRIGYWGADGQTRVERAIQQIRTDRGLEQEPGWTVNYYPEDGPVGLVEVLLDVPPEEPEISKEETMGEEMSEGGEVKEEPAEEGKDTPEEENMADEAETETGLEAEIDDAEKII